MTYRTIVPTQAQIEMFENDMKNLTVENLNLEGIENCSQQFKEELVADTIAFATSFKNGTLQVCEGEIGDILNEIIEENTKARNALKAIKSSKVKSLQY